MRVLAADDDSAVVRVLDRCLRGWGYEPVLALDGAEAWRVLKQEDAPLVVILDWDMPGLSGLEVCRLLRAKPKGDAAYVLVLTARQHKDDLIEALEAGADDFLSKPFHVRELQLRLAKGVSTLESRSSGNAGRRGENPPPTGSTLGGKYRLERKIAEGGMATVWLGVHLSLGINVAIKFMKAGLTERADFASFEREARAAAQLRSEHIVRIYDHGIDQNGLPYLVMEYLVGESLAARVGRLGPMPLAEVVDMVQQVARALGEAHSQGIVHGDVKPENILLIEDSERPLGFHAKLVDFGLANRMLADTTRETSHVAGTPAYMSPEHLRGEAPPNSALDLWGLAATAFAALTGVGPFAARKYSEVYDRVCVAALPVASEIDLSVPPSFDAWFARACTREPEWRYASALDLANSLQLGCSTEPPSAGRIAVRAGPFAPTEPGSDPKMTMTMPTRRDGER